MSLPPLQVTRMEGFQMQGFYRSGSRCRACAGLQGLCRSGSRWEQGRVGVEGLVQVRVQGRSKEGFYRILQTEGLAMTD